MKDEARVQAHTSSAVINFAEHSTPELLAPYLPSLLESLHGLLEAPKIAQEQAVTAVAAVADCVGKHLPLAVFLMPQWVIKNLFASRGICEPYFLLLRSSICSFLWIFRTGNDGNSANGPRQGGTASS